MHWNDGRGIVIQERDLHFLHELATFRVVDREQAKIIAGFGSTTRVNARLLALTRTGFLRRFFLGTTAGGTKALYSLSQKGAQFVGVPLRGPRRRGDMALVGDRFVEHQLAVNGIYCSLKVETAKSGIALERWMGFQKSVASHVELIPDAYFEIESTAGTLAAFLELDLGTESLTVLREKAHQYVQYAISDHFRSEFGQGRLRVLMIGHSERRMRSIRQVVASLTEKLFWFGSLEAIQRDGLLAPLWLRPKGDEKIPLIPKLQ